MDLRQDDGKSMLSSLSYVHHQEEDPDVVKVQHLESTVRRLQVKCDDKRTENGDLYNTMRVLEQERDEALLELEYQRAENRRLIQESSERARLIKELNVDSLKTAKRKFHTVQGRLLDDNLYTELEEKYKDLVGKHKRVQTHLDKKEKQIMNLTTIHSGREERLEKDIRSLEGALATEKKLIGRYAYRVDELENQFNGEGRAIIKVKSRTPGTKTGELQLRQAKTERAKTAGTRSRPTGVPTFGRSVTNFLGGLVAGILLTVMLVRFAFLNTLADTAGGVRTTIALTPKSTGWPTPNNIPYWPGFVWYYALGYCPEWWIKLVWNLAWWLKKDNEWSILG